MDDDKRYWILKILPLAISHFLIDTFRLNNEHICRMYIELNNRLVLMRHKACSTSEILLLLPHCLQHPECTNKVTDSTAECKTCGRCDIGETLKVCRKYGVAAAVVTGGLAARDVLKRLKVKAAVAVACEKELYTGLKDMRHIDVIGIINKRPNGPCRHTKADIAVIEKTILSIT